MSNSTLAKADRKTKAPKFPLWTHKGTGLWCKKVRGKFHYFGSVADDPKGDAALTLWTEQKDDLLAGRKPRAKSDTASVGAICNAFLTHKRARLENGEITPRTWHDYRATTDLLVDHFGATRPIDDLRPDDFEELRAKLAKSLGVVALGNQVQRIRSVFRYGDEAGLILQRVRFGPGFARPSKKSLRLARAEKGPRLFTADDLRKLIDAASVHIKAMILLGINGGLGNGELAGLRTKHLDLDGGWIDYPRPKTGVRRRAKLWPETIAAIKASLAKRPTHKDEADVDLVFVTKHGHGWGKLGRFEVSTIDDPDAKKPKVVSGNNALAKEFKKLAGKVGVARTFYDLRHTYRTHADEAKDQPAIDLTMGHADDSMASVYRESISDARLEAVAAVVRGWLHPKPAKAKTTPKRRRNQTGRKNSRKNPRPQFRVVSA